MKLHKNFSHEPLHHGEHFWKIAKFCAGGRRNFASICENSIFIMGRKLNRFAQNPPNEFSQKFHTLHTSTKSLWTRTFKRFQHTQRVKNFNVWKNSPKTPLFLHFDIFFKMHVLIFYETFYNKGSSQVLQIYKKLGKSFRQILKSRYVLLTTFEKRIFANPCLISHRPPAQNFTNF